MGIALTTLSILCSIAILVCFVLVVWAMIQNQQTTLAIVCIVLAFCGGLGILVAFIFGWVKTSEWGVNLIMMAFTAAFILLIIARVAGIFSGVAMMAWS